MGINSPASRGIFHTDLSAKQPGRAHSGDATSNNAVTLGNNTQSDNAQGNNAQVFRGSGATAANQAPQSTMSSFAPGEFNLNFQDADIREVVQSILGDTLKENYTIDPGIGGTVTLSSARPLSRDDLLPALEAVLQQVGAVLVHHDGLYQVSIEASAVATTVDRLASSSGYGLSIVPIEYVSAKTLITLIEGFGVRPGSVRAEARRNLLIILGSGADRQSAVETALSFDADWMQDQSVGILPLKHSKPETIIPELQRIFASSQGDVGADLVQFMPMQRLRAVLVVSSRSVLIDRARTWVQRLDVENSDLQANVLVYRVKYRDAEKLAGLLSSIFGGSGAFTPNTPAAQVQPGTDAVSLAGLTPGGDQSQPPPLPGIDTGRGAPDSGQSIGEPSSRRRATTRTNRACASRRTRPTTRW